jgi:hypothetical protein
MERILLAWSFLAILAAAAAAQSNGFVTIAPEPAYYAWWLRAEFHPFETQVRGIPIDRIRTTWCKASEFRKDLFPLELAADIETNHASFSADADFDGSNVRQTALIGVYETCGGERGSFLLVLAFSPAKPPVIRFVHEFPGLQFGIVHVAADATIEMSHCMECDHITRFGWNRASKRFVRLKPPNEN